MDEGCAMNPLLALPGYITLLIAGLIIVGVGFLIDESEVVLRFIIGFIGLGLIAVAILAIVVVR
ncbi:MULTISPECIES: hypothetical protein [Candidatus Nitrosocaldus]|jgi:hypothetical protein|uniref:Uncharacterized protein n=1 Tax=Candidatus Nitrosocaldus cavascurensis TaxID=2058097 RepID=A0A2K5API5_9ARCH|nr:MULTISPECIES: hypothetical protein [Candidatus Nitrosocaldus]SPC33568.1 protein of unknown function [Candidatus Nitrosocaldus cavascurensis]